MLKRVSIYSFILLKATFLLLLLLCNTNGLYADSREQSVHVKEELVFSDSLLHKLQEQKIYSNYLNETAKTSSIKEWLRKVFMWLSRHFSGSSTGRGVIQALPYLLVALVIVLIALKAYGLSFRGLVSPENRKVVQLSGNDEEDIQRNDLPQLINNAAEHKQYREAIRLSYLLILRQLNEAEIIHWAVSKTNIEYLYAIKQPDIREQYKQLMNIYEHTWYGDKPWGTSTFEDNFEQVKELDNYFKTLNKD